MDVCRVINEMVFVMLFVVVVGFGSFVGVLACWRCLFILSACFLSCFSKRWKRLSSVRWKVFALSVLISSKRFFTACCYR